MVVGVIDEIRLTAEYRDGGWTVTGEAESELGIDLFQIVEEIGKRLGFDPRELLEHLFKADVDPRLAVGSARVEHGPEATRIGAQLVLPPVLAFDLSRLPLVGDNVGQIELKGLGVAVVREGEAPWKVHIVGDLLVAGEKLDDLAVPVAAAAPSEPQAVVPERHVFGPLTIDNFLVDFHDGALRMRVNARLGRGGVAVDVIGLYASVRLDDLDNPSFGIDGLAVMYDIPPVAISGGLLLILDQDPRRFDGSLSVRAGDYGFSAVGSYADTSPPSLFAFLQVLVPIGGPPYFYVKGVAGGFGLNRDLRLPPVEELTGFPLIQGSGGPDPFEAGSTVDAAIAHIQPFMQPVEGRNWLAAGVAVASFGILQTQAVLTLSFGDRVEIGVLGVALLEFPPVGRQVVRARMVLRTVITPSVGELSVIAQLTSDSYVLAPECRLTGGFALCFWFKPHPHAGDFVVSLGGYHPDFRPPPTIPASPASASPGHRAGRSSSRARSTSRSPRAW